MKLCIKARQFPDHIGNLLHVCQGFEPEQLIDIQIDKHRQRRSLDANAYCWVLLDKLAAVLRKPKTEIYRELIREVGGNCETYCGLEKAVDKLVQLWEKNGIGWCADVTDSKLEGCKNVVLYQGSSTYDTRQMSRLIDLVVQECRAQGIETATPAELEKLKEAWH
jgi:hypothetical protein